MCHIIHQIIISHIININSEHGADLTYMIAMFDDDVDPPKKILTIPEWVEWDDQVPSLHVHAPLNLSNINPVYEFRVMAMVDDDKEEMAEEKLIVVIAHSCFNKCPKHFGVGCEDWDKYMMMAGVYSIVMFTIGCIGHCILSTLHEWRMNRMRKRRVDDDRIARRIEYKKLKISGESDEDHWSSDDDDVYYKYGRPKPLWEKIRRWPWICYINCCCLKMDRIV